MKKIILLLLLLSQTYAASQATFSVGAYKYEGAHDTHIVAQVGFGNVSGNDFHCEWSAFLWIDPVLTGLQVHPVPTTLSGMWLGWGVPIGVSEWPIMYAVTPEPGLRSLPWSPWTTQGEIVQANSEWGGSAWIWHQAPLPPSFGGMIWVPTSIVVADDVVPQEIAGLPMRVYIFGRSYNGLYGVRYYSAITPVVL